MMKVITIGQSRKGQGTFSDQNFKFTIVKGLVLQIVEMWLKVGRQIF